MFNDCLSPILLRMLLVGLFAIVWVRVASAAPEAMCRQYAQDAVNANEWNRTQGCELTGPSWSSDYQGHYRWCIGAQESSVNNERANRQNGINNCKYCGNFAREAVEAQRKNVANGCNLSGPRWSSNRVGHYRWCMASQRSSVEQEARFRNFDAGKCEQCTIYARQAVESSEQNRRLSCGFTGPQWTSDYPGHYKWCWNLQTRASLTTETNNRANLLRQCQTSPALKSTCDSYAKLAIAQYNETRSRSSCNSVTGVGYNKQRWHNNYQNHYGWCLAVPESQRSADQNARERELEKCRGVASRPGVPAAEQCLVSVTIKNRSCRNVDGTASSIAQGSLSAHGCGDTVDKAKARARVSMASGQCITEGDEPQNGCCTFTEQPVQGCLCGSQLAPAARSATQQMQQSAPSQSKKAQPAVPLRKQPTQMEGLRPYQGR